MKSLSTLLTHYILLMAINLNIRLLKGLILLLKNFFKKKIKALVVACNTATVNTIELLRKQTDIPIIGVEPAIKPATMYTKNNNVGVLVTQSTSTNERFLALIEKYSAGVNVHIQPCPGLVQLIEQGDINTHKCESLLNHYLTPLIEKDVDTIVLGCTHYPFLIEKINSVCGKDVNIIDTAEPVTKQLQRQLQKLNLCTPLKNCPSIDFFSSKPSLFLDNLGSNLLNEKVSFKLF